MSIVKARLIALTQPLEETGIPSAEDLIVYCARVSNQGNQSNFETGEKLLQYCIRNKHWSIFEMVDAVVEVKVPGDVASQLTRHRSFSFQEFSQRYSSDIEMCDREVRMQDTKNRQNSNECTDVETIDWWEKSVELYRQAAKSFYNECIKRGVAKEVARVVLPKGLTMSTLYMKGSLRSFIHYLDVREGNGTQKEHRLLANEIRKCLLPAFPKVLGVMND